MIPHIELFGSGTLLELAALHGIHFVTAPNKDGLCNIVVRHLILGECQTTDAALCNSICSTLLPPPMPNTPMDLRLLILDVVIDLGPKKTLRHVLDCVGIAHNPTNPVSVLQSLLDQHRNTFFVQGQHPQLNGCSVPIALSDVADGWPWQVSHSDKTRIVHDFRTTMSSNELKTVTCAPCPEKVHVGDVLNHIASDLDLNILHSPPSLSSD